MKHQAATQDKICSLMPMKLRVPEDIYVQEKNEFLANG